MSALGHKPTCAVQKGISALPPKADMCGATRDVRYGPIADSCSATKRIAIRSLRRRGRRRRFEIENHPRIGSASEVSLQPWPGKGCLSAPLQLLLMMSEKKDACDGQANRRDQNYQGDYPSHEFNLLTEQIGTYSEQ
jgi:hypothetical protein